MGEQFDLSFCELRAKEIINTFDGSRLGRIIDIIFSSSSGEVKGIVVPYCRRLFFSRSQEIFIPWKCINKIGEDVILVCLIDDGFVGAPGKGKRRRHEHMRELKAHEQHDGHGGFDKHSGGYEKHEKHGGYKVHAFEDSSKAESKSDYQEAQSHTGLPNCDRKCEKCMLFDCEYRWKLD